MARTPDPQTRPVTDEELMERYVDGDSAAFEKLYGRIASRLFGYLLKLTRHREQAEDLLQVTFTKVHRARGSYLTGSPVLPWVYAIARHSFYDEQRARKARRESLTRDGVLPESRHAQSAARIELPHILRRALAQLPAGHRDAVVLTKLYGLSGDEAAAALHTTRTAIKVRVHRANQILRQVLQPA